MSVRLVAAFALAVLGLSACGSQEDSTDKFPSGDRRAVAKTIEDLQKAGERGDAKKVCTDLLASKVASSMRDGGCEKTVERQLDDADTFDLSVESVTITPAAKGAPARATARVKSRESDKDRFDTFTLVKEAGRWKVESLGGA